MALLSKPPRWEEPLSLVLHMQSSGVAPNPITFGSLLNMLPRACKMKSMWARSSACLTSMTQMLLESNALIYSALMGSYDWKRALHLLEGMEALDRRPNIFVCGLVATVSLPLRR